MNMSASSSKCIQVLNFAPESETEEGADIFVRSLAPLTSEILFQVVDESVERKPIRKIENSETLMTNNSVCKEISPTKSVTSEKSLSILKNKPKTKNISTSLDNIKFSFEELSGEIGCGLCGGLLRQAFMIFPCLHNCNFYLDCKICLAR